MRLENEICVLSGVCCDLKDRNQVVIESRKMGTMDNVIAKKRLLEGPSNFKLWRDIVLMYLRRTCGISSIQTIQMSLVQTKSQDCQTLVMS